MFFFFFKFAKFSLMMMTPVNISSIRNARLIKIIRIITSRMRMIISSKYEVVLDVIFKIKTLHVIYTEGSEEFL